MTDERAVLLWQINDLIRQLAWGRLFWAVQRPDLWGMWLP